MKRKIDGDTITVLDDYDNAVLTIKVTIEESAITIAAAGRMTHDAAPEFEDELMAILTSGRDVVVDFSELEHISAPALEALLSVQKLVDERRYKFSIKNISKPVEEIFKQTGFIDLIAIH